MVNMKLCPMVLRIIQSVLILSGLLSCFIVMFGNPGFSLETWRQLKFRKEGKRYEDYLNCVNICRHCRVPYPGRRLEHCDLCGLCVEDLDHHCVFFGKCIAKKNIIFFYISIYAFLISLFSYMGLSVYESGV